MISKQPCGQLRSSQMKRDRAEKQKPNKIGWTAPQNRGVGFLKQRKFLLSKVLYTLIGIRTKEM